MAMEAQVGHILYSPHINIKSYCSHPAVSAQTAGSPLTEGVTGWPCVLHIHLLSLPFVCSYTTERGLVCLWKHREQENDLGSRHFDLGNNENKRTKTKDILNYHQVSVNL